MSVEDETWDRPICKYCAKEIQHGEKTKHYKGKCVKDLSPKVYGLPEHLLKYKIAHFFYHATGEGVTLEAQILDNDVLKPVIGWGGCPPTIIPAVIEKELFNQKYLDWNPEFKAKFYEVFGIQAWEYFLNAAYKNASINLKMELHYNLS